VSIAEIIKRLQEDRVIAERERRQARIESEFAKARTIERRRFGCPASTDPELYGRRKDDVVAQVATETPKKLVPLSKQVAPLLDQIKATGMPHLRRHDVVCWDLGEEPVVTDVPKLLTACEIALGFAPPEDGLKCNKTDAEPSIWKRPVKIGKGKP
jgi:hypothetical protein